MKKILLSILALVFLFFLSLSQGYAAELPTCDKKEFSCYQKFANYCKDLSNPWMKYPDLGKTAKCEYGEFTAAGINATITCIEASENGGNTTGYKE